MAVVIGTRTGFELVAGAAAEDVRRGEALRPGPRVLRSFEDTRRPTTPRPRPLAVPATPDPAACQVREDTRHPVVQFALYAAMAVAAAVTLSLLYLYGSGATTVPERTSVIHVQVGETLWDVAERNAPDSNPEAVVDRIKKLNNLDSPSIKPGQPLVVPDGRTDPPK
ncbi:LysM peptidoglycan-binding domain-containing protein [Actinosynnema sp. CS-041913]|uniref:LysM peptidoglycan-binding domain-containing protein n=1 Tax=Actinosynnema sp. CS-041913 TaxID=3239917 RepID=UPI003D8E5BCF